MVTVIRSRTQIGLETTTVGGRISWTLVTSCLVRTTDNVKRARNQGVEHSAYPFAGKRAKTPAKTSRTTSQHEDSRQEVEENAQH